MKSLIKCTLGLLVSLLIIGAVDVRAQSVTSAQVTGQVTDSSGAVVPQASITITNVDTAASRKVESNATGAYIIPLLPPGNYRMAVEKEGFQTAEIPGLILQINQSLIQDVGLKVGALSQKVTVEAEVPQLQTTSSNLGQVITARAIVDLPLNGRNFTQLLALTPGVSSYSTSPYAGVGSGFGATPALPTSANIQPSVNGQWNRSNVYLLDGVNITGWYTNTVSILPIVDTLQEFKVQSHNDSSEYGSALGGIVNVVSKSGTNSLHGAAWEFLRNDKFDARNPFTDATRSSPPPFRQNQFGFTVGGPVVLPKVYDGRDKSWFFVGYEGWRYHNYASGLSRYPTAAELSGDFSQTYTTQRLFDPATTVADPNSTRGYTRQPFVCDAGGTPVAQGTAGATPCNKIPANRINPLSQNFFGAVYDNPNLTGNPLYNFQYIAVRTNRDDSWNARYDQRFGDHDTAWFRVLTMRMPIASPRNSKVASTSNDKMTNIAVGETHLFSPTVVFDTRFGYNGHESTGASTVKGVDIDGFVGMGFTSATKYGGPGLFLRDGNYSSFGAGGPNTSHVDDWTFDGTLTWINGKHSIKGGYQFYYLSAGAVGYGNGYAFYNDQTNDPENSSATGDSLASALLGLPANIDYSNLARAYHFPFWGIFAEDRIQITPKLSLTLGVRYDYVHEPRLTEGVVNQWDPNTGNWLIGGGVMPQACNVVQQAPCIPGDGLQDVPFGEHIVLAKTKDGGPPSIGNWAPRLGVAWRATAKTVVRLGAGIAYDSAVGRAQLFDFGVGTWPENNQIRENPNRLGEAFTTLQDVQQRTLTSLPGPSPWEIVNWMYDPNLKNARSYQWNAQIQRQLQPNLLLAVAYVGSKSDRLNAASVFNTAWEPGGGRDNRPFPWMTVEEVSRSLGRANFQGLQFSLEKRYSQGLQFQASYSYSHATDNAGSGFLWYYEASPGYGGLAETQNPYDLNSNWGTSANNISHNVSVAAQYELPVGKGKNHLVSGPLSHVFGNWQLNVITAVRSGAPINVSVGGDPANVGWPGGFARPNVVGDPNDAPHDASMWFNPAALAAPVNEYGNMEKNSLRTAAMPNVDLSLFKKFPIKESVELEFRAEAFNAFNIQTLGFPGSVLDWPGVGVISSTASTPRQFQFALKVRF